MSVSNLFLSALSEDLLCEIRQASSVVVFPVPGIRLIEASVRPHHLYFLENGFASYVVHTLDGGSLEVGMVGREGLVGSASLLGDGTSPTECLLQSPASTLQLPLAAAEAFFRNSEEFRKHLLRFVQTEEAVARQMAACTYLHDAQQRLSRWLLMVADRVGKMPIPVTQEGLAAMLGTQRSTMSITASNLQRRGLIDYSRGKIKVLDLAGLHQLSCECYQPIRQGDPTGGRNLFMQPTFALPKLRPGALHGKMVPTA